MVSISPGYSAAMAGTGAASVSTRDLIGRPEAEEHPSCEARPGTDVLALAQALLDPSLDLGQQRRYQQVPDRRHREGLEDAEVGCVLTLRGGQDLIHSDHRQQRGVLAHVDVLVHGA